MSKAEMIEQLLDDGLTLEEAEQTTNLLID